VPDECLVVGFADVSAAAFYNPPLTTVRQSMEDLGSIGAGIFLRATEGQPRDGVRIRSVRQKVDPVLMVRASTAWQANPLEVPSPTKAVSPRR